MKRFSTSISIHAPAHAVWALLTNAAGYSEWNSTVERIDGRIAPGEKVTVHAKSAPGRAFPLRVSAFEPCAKMVWVGGMPAGLFTGTRSFTLASSANGQVGFAMEESYSGLLASLITRSIPDLQPSFDIFAADLKSRAEATAQQAG